MERVAGLDTSELKRWRTLVCEDGGYRDLEDALCELLQGKVGTTAADRDARAATPQRARSLEPAIESGAPRAAATELKRRLGSLGDRTARPAAASAGKLEVSPRPASSALRVAGYLAAVIMALGVGYYLLCLMLPTANFLGISLPGVQATSETNDKAPPVFGQ